MLLGWRLTNGQQRLVTIIMGQITCRLNTADFNPGLIDDNSLLNEPNFQPTKVELKKFVDV